MAKQKKNRNFNNKILAEQVALSFENTLISHSTASS
jgi:hypothetical protein